jgi:hypothetical protein
VTLDQQYHCPWYIADGESAKTAVKVWESSAREAASALAKNIYQSVLAKFVLATYGDVANTNKLVVAASAFDQLVARHVLAGDVLGAFQARCADLGQARIQVGDGGLGVGRGEGAGAAGQQGGGDREVGQFHGGSSPKRVEAVPPIWAVPAFRQGFAWL